MLDFDQVRVLTFDCYGTLIDWERGILTALHPLLAARGVNVSDEALLESYASLEAEIESESYRSYRQVLREVVAGFGLRHNFVATAAEMDALPNSLADWEPFPDTVAALQSLATQYKLAIISNIDDDLFAQTAAKLSVSFAHVITAQQVGSYKPSRQNFITALDRIREPKEHVLHVAQSLYHDIVPAKELGLATVWVNRRAGLQGFGATLPAESWPDLEVPSLELLAELMVADSE